MQVVKNFSVSESVYSTDVSPPDISIPDMSKVASFLGGYCTTNLTKWLARKFWSSYNRVNELKGLSSNK